MPANRFNGFTDYGIGLGLRVPHYEHILTRKPTCDWFEIISENFMVDGGRPLEVLDRILEQYRVVQHGVSLYLGSADKPDRTHLKKLKALVKRTKTPWLSDHLCWGSVDGTYSHDLLPMPYTFAAARRTAAQNHGFDPYAYLAGVPLERVAQIHVAGHTTFEKYVLDTHDHPVSDPVWKLYAHAIRAAGVTATLLEWDDKIPSFDEVHAEALKANAFIAGARAAGAGRGGASRADTRRPRGRVGDSPAPGPRS